MKKMFLFLFCGMLIVTGCTENDYEPSGTVGSLTWELSKDGTFTIAGVGEMPDYWVTPTENLPPWFAFRNDITDVIIGNEVSKIGDYAFFRCGNLVSVAIGNSITTIGRDAFSGCSSLISVIIPNSVTDIERGAFYECTNIRSVTIPNSVVNIGDYAFSNCSGLMSLTIGSSVAKIGEHAFYSCIGLTGMINYQKTPQIIDEFVFGEVNKTVCTLFVPADSEGAYRAADGWKDFVNIRTIE